MILLVLPSATLFTSCRIIIFVSVKIAKERSCKSIYVCYRSKYPDAKYSRCMQVLFARKRNFIEA